MWCNTKKRCPFHHRGPECKSRKSRDTESSSQVWTWSTKWSRAKVKHFCQKNTLVIVYTLFQQHKRQLYMWTSVQFSSVQLLSRVRLLATPWIAARQASLSITNSWSSLRLMTIELVMPSSYLILCHPLLLLPPIPPSIRVFSSESALLMRWPNASASVLPMNTQDWSLLEWTGWISLQSKGLSRVFSNTTVQKHQFFGTQLSSQSNSHIHTWPLGKP